MLFILFNAFYYSTYQRTHMSAKFKSSSIGHVSLSYSANNAVVDGQIRERQKKEVYDAILLMCLRQIRSAATTSCKSVVFNVPRKMTGHVMTYDIKTAVEYLIVALREDKGFYVRKTSSTQLYIRWETEEQKEYRIKQKLALKNNNPQKKPLHNPQRKKKTYAKKVVSHNCDVDDILDTLKKR